MHFAHVLDQTGRPGLAVGTGDGFRGRSSDEPQYPGELLALLQEGRDALSRAASSLSGGDPVDLEKVTLKPPVTRPDKIICAGLNFRGHITGSGFEEPKVPDFFGRFPTRLIGHGEPLLRPRDSDELDFEGAIGAQASHPGRQVISLSGDGGLAMLLGELLTLKQLHLPVKVVVFNNGALSLLFSARVEEAGQLEDGSVQP